MGEACVGFLLPTMSFGPTSWQVRRGPESARSALALATAGTTPLRTKHESASRAASTASPTSSLFAKDPGKVKVELAEFEVHVAVRRDRDRPSGREGAPSKSPRARSTMAHAASAPDCDATSSSAAASRPIRAKRSASSSCRAPRATTQGWRRRSTGSPGRPLVKDLVVPAPCGLRTPRVAVHVGNHSSQHVDDRTRNGARSPGESDRQLHSPPAPDRAHPPSLGDLLGDALTTPLESGDSKRIAQHLSWSDRAPPRPASARNTWLRPSST